MIADHSVILSDGINHSLTQSINKSINQPINQPVISDHSALSDLPYLYQ